MLTHEIDSVEHSLVTVDVATPQKSNEVVGWYFDGFFSSLGRTGPACLLKWIVALFDWYRVCRNLPGGNKSPGTFSMGPVMGNLFVGELGPFGLQLSKLTLKVEARANVFLRYSLGKYPPRENKCCGRVAG